MNDIEPKVGCTDRLRDWPVGLSQVFGHKQGILKCFIAKNRLEPE